MPSDGSLPRPRLACERGLAYRDSKMSPLLVILDAISLYLFVIVGVDLLSLSESAGRNRQAAVAELFLAF